MLNTSFNGKNKIFKYSHDTYGFVSNATIDAGEFVQVDVSKDGKPITKQVVEILEQRVSRGQFAEGTEKPMWYKLKVSA